MHRKYVMMCSILSHKKFFFALSLHPAILWMFARWHHRIIAKNSQRQHNKQQNAWLNLHFDFSYAAAIMDEQGRDNCNLSIDHFNDNQRHLNFFRGWEILHNSFQFLYASSSARSEISKIIYCCHPYKPHTHPLLLLRHVTIKYRCHDTTNIPES